MCIFQAVHNPKLILCQKDTNTILDGVKLMLVNVI